VKKFDFKRRELPWLDRQSIGIDDYVARLKTDEDKELLRYQLLHWSHFGYVILPGAIEHELIDALLADLDEILARYTEFSTMVDSTVPKYKYLKLKEVDKQVIDDVRAGDCSVRLRLMDFIHHSVAAKLVSVHPNITRFMEHVSGQRMVAFQSLSFFVGSEQAIHQDYAFVPTPPRAQLMASWVALEDIQADAGPLEYIPGSHRLRKFDWEPGLYLAPGVARNETDFSEHIERERLKAGLPRLTFCPSKGDVFIWHGALAHGGSAVTNPKRTRKSHVTHYGLASKHRTHVHSEGKRVDRIEYPGGFVLRTPQYPDEEDVLRNGGAPI
jgi:ectoine hydroxylase-related dioxygenase (phytanoyl-CoA dioxygenase family)